MFEKWRFFNLIKRYLDFKLPFSFNILNYSGGREKRRKGEGEEEREQCSHVEAKGQIPLSLVPHLQFCDKVSHWTGSSLTEYAGWLAGQGASGILLSPPPSARILTWLQDSGPPAYLANAIPRAISPAPWKCLKIELVNKQAMNRIMVKEPTSLLFVNSSHLLLKQDLKVRWHRLYYTFPRLFDTVLFLLKPT